MSRKIRWEGLLISVEPRIRLSRSFDQRYHSYLGYVLRIRGVLGDSEQEVLIAVGKAAHAKHRFRVGDRIKGESEPVLDSRLECAKFYKTVKLSVIVGAGNVSPEPPPWLGIAPDLETYQLRGHRRLAARTYDAKCRSCIWGCPSPSTGKRGQGPGASGRALRVNIL